MVKDFFYEALMDCDVDDQELIKKLDDLSKEKTIADQQLYTDLISSGRNKVLRHAFETDLLDPNFIDDEGASVLMLCVHCAHDAELVFKYILNRFGETDKSFRFIACYSNMISKCMIETLMAGADPNLESDSQDPPLSQSVFGEQVALTNILLGYGADPNFLLDDRNESILEVASNNKEKSWFINLCHLSKKSLPER